MATLSISNPNLNSVFPDEEVCTRVTYSFCKNPIYKPVEKYFWDYTHPAKYNFLPERLSNLMQDSESSKTFLALIDQLSSSSQPCHPDLNLFLCAVISPLCILTSDKPPIIYTPSTTLSLYSTGDGKLQFHTMPPCRSLCEEVLNKCKAQISFHFVSDPNLFQITCDHLPQTKGALESCVGKNSSTSQPSYSPSLTTPYQSNPTRSPTVTTTRPLSTPNAIVGEVEAAQTFTSDSCPSELRVRTGYDYNLRLGEHVVPDCGAPCSGAWTGGDEGFKWVAKRVIGYLAILCSLTTLFTLFTFLIDMKRFKYPERPIIYLSGCYMVIALTYMVGFFLNDQFSCVDSFASPPRAITTTQQNNGLSNATPGSFVHQVVTQGAKETGCTVMFMLLYFFTMSASIWWCILCFTWFLAAGLKWAHEAIAQRSQYFHLASWALPAIMAIAILASGQINGDPLSGTCFTGLSDTSTLRIFIFVPLCLCLIIGLGFLIAGFVALFHIRQIIKKNGSQTGKFEKLMLRIGIFSLLYTVPAIVVIACYLHEMINRDPQTQSWFARKYCPNPTNAEQVRLCKELRDAGYTHNASSGQNSGGSGVNGTQVALLLKYLMLLLVGIASTFWVWSFKTVQSWQSCFLKIFCCRFSSRNDHYEPAISVQSPSVLPSGAVTASNSANQMSGHNPLLGPGHMANGGAHFPRMHTQSNSQSSGLGVGYSASSQQIQLMQINESQQPLLSANSFLRPPPGMGNPNSATLHTMQNLTNMANLHAPNGLSNAALAHSHLSAGLTLMPQSQMVGGKPGMQQPVVVGVGQMGVGMPGAQSSSASTGTGLTQQSVSASGAAPSSNLNKPVTATSTLGPQN